MGVIAKLTGFFGQFPQHCLICQQSSTNLVCTHCFDDLALYPTLENLLIRPDIRRQLKSPKFATLKALTPYQWPLAHLINQLKFSGKIVIAKAMADLFIRQYADYSPKGDVVLIPVPLHSTRFKDRKYNQSFEIAKHLALHWKTPLATHLVKRIKHTQPQSELTAKQRRNNLKGAFAVQNNLIANHIILFDDVITTGATVNNLCDELLAHYPHLTIEVWCLCITHRH